MTQVTHVDGFATEVVRLGAAGDAPYHIVYVPGNPGIPGYYGSTCVKLGLQLNATAAIIGLRGHSIAPLLGPTTTFDLETQCVHIAQFLQSEAESLRTASGARGKAAPRLIVVGHSIGAYIALQGAMKCASSPRDEVACAVGLMPYLDNTGIEENYALRSKVRLAASWVAPIITLFVGVIAQLLGTLLPAAARRALLSAETSKFDPPAARLTETAALSFRFVANMLGLFRSEAKNHETPFDFDALKDALGEDRVGLIYVDDSADFWAAAASAQRAERNGIQARPRRWSSM